MAGFTSYAETVSVYGSEGAFIDGDDTPWSKAFLAAAYASRGVKMRATSGAGSELLMGFHQSQSLLYLEARCLCLQRAMGVQGTQNGGIDGAPVTMSIQGGGRELMAENLIAVWLDLECASGNDARPTESEIRVGAKIMPYLIAGSDLICSGFGSILKYDNSFNPSLLNGEELEDFLVLQRDFDADGGLTPIGEERAMALRERALDALCGGPRGARPRRADARDEGERRHRLGLERHESFTAGEASRISEAIKARGIDVVEVIRHWRGAASREEAENLLALVRLRLSGDTLQTSALDPGRPRPVRRQRSERLCAGPGSGYRVAAGAPRRARRHPRRHRPARGAALAGDVREGRGEARPLSRAAARREPSGAAPRWWSGLSPAFGSKLFKTLAGEPVSAMLSRRRRRAFEASGVDGPRRAHATTPPIPRSSASPPRGSRAPASASASRPRARP